MNELLLHRSDVPETAGGLHVWGWEIPVYLFLGGLVAGLLALGGVALLRRPAADADRTWRAPLLALVLLSLGMFALFLDLGNRWQAWRMYLVFRPGSPMSWGAWILVLVYPALAAAALLGLPERAPAWAGARAAALLARARGWSQALGNRPGAVRAVAWANVLGGVALGVYTGVLLGSLGARPLWNSALLGPLFLVSGLSTAAALLHLRSARPGAAAGTAGTAGAAGAVALLRADAAFIAVELLFVALWLIGLSTATAVHRTAAELVVSGPYAPAFWGFVVLTGLVLPLGLQLAELSGRIRHTLAPAVMVLAGGFALRWILVTAGQASHW